LAPWKWRPACGASYATEKPDVRQILLNPGPVTLTPRVRAALTRGDWCHREPEFAALTREINAALATVHAPLAADFEAVTLACSGTGAVEAMLGAFAPTASATLVVANGVYGERMARMLTAQRRPHRVLELPWTSPIDAEVLEAQLIAQPDLTHVAVVHHETTTGRLNELDVIGTLCARLGRTLLLDAVSSFGAERIEAGRWNLGALAGTASKCLHGAPGVSFVLARRDHWPSAASGSSVYLDAKASHAAQHKDGFALFTLPVQIAFALREALAEHAEQGGVPARRTLFEGRATRIAAALDAAGVQTLLPRADYSSVLWSWRLPAGRTYGELHDALKSAGYVIYAGQGRLGAEIFRIAHMGDIDEEEIARLCALLPTLCRSPS
jgi:2-aminoethylphosphonate-pyruvate transaminase